jgi:hypothetical protein
MRTRLVALLILVGAGVLAAADSKGFCPPTPPRTGAMATKTLVPQTPPSPDAQFIGAVMLMAVISDKGYVCDVQVIRKVDKETDKKAATAVRQWYFQSALKDEHPVAVVVTVEVNYWRKDGEIVQFPATPTVMQTQGQPTH